MAQFRQGGFQQIPLIVKNLLIINILVFLIQQACQSRHILILGSSFEDIFALHYWQSPKFHWWQLFTHMFMHGSWSHIAFNMFALWMFGRILENVWGPQRFLVFYLICGVGAAMCHLGVLTYEFLPFQRALAQYQLHPNINDFIRIGNAYPLSGNLDDLNRFVQNWRMQPDSISYIGQSLDILKTAFKKS